MSVKQIIDNLSSVLSTELFAIGGTQVTLGTLLVAGLVVVLTFGLSSLAQRGGPRPAGGGFMTHGRTALFLEAAQLIVEAADVCLGSCKRNETCELSRVRALWLERCEVDGGVGFVVAEGVDGRLTFGGQLG